MERTPHSMDKRQPLENVRFVCKRSSIRMKLLVLAVVVFSTATLLTLTLKLRDEKLRQDQLRSQAISQEQEKSRLEQYIAEKGTIQGIIRIAMEELGLVEPDHIIIQPE